MRHLILPANLPFLPAFHPHSSLTPIPPKPPTKFLHLRRSPLRPTMPSSPKTEYETMEPKTEYETMASSPKIEYEIEYETMASSPNTEYKTMAPKTEYETMASLPKIEYETMAPKTEYETTASLPKTEYERRRLDNIRRNSEMMSSLKLHQKSTDLTQSLKRPRPTKSPKPKPPPTVLRRSLRHRGISPSSSSASASTPPPTPQSPPRKCSHLRIADALVDGPPSPAHQLLDEILAAAPAAQQTGRAVGRSDPRLSLSLTPQNAVKVVSDRIMSVTFFPVADRTIVVAGNKLGHVGIWDADSQESDRDRVYLYAPHSSPVSGISIHPFSANKMYTSSYDGYVRVMDVEKETFNIIYSIEDLVFSICQWPNDINSLYIGEGAGELKVWDERAGKASSTWVLHKARVNTIDFNPQNLNLMATSSSDGTACIWDLRRMERDGPERLKTVKHSRAVHSAFFSPGGISLATTSYDDRIGLLSGADFEQLHMIKHNNLTGRWLSSFRAVWGWDDTYLYVGNMKRAVDVISTVDKTTTDLQSPDMTSIPCRFAAHPFKEGYLAGAASGGKVYLWTRS